MDLRLNTNWILVSLVNFLIASLIGLLLRGAFVWEINWMDYRYMLHAHSHVALLGWVYLGLFILLHKRLLPEKLAKKKVYTWLFWLTQVSVVGMIISFPLQGYALYSVIFSTLHILLSYIFGYHLWKDHMRDNPIVSVFLKTAIFFLGISTLGVAMVAVIMANGEGGGVLYQAAIQFYLHFQFNGWVLFAVLALLFKYFEFGSAHLKKIRVFYWLMFIGNFLTYALVLYWAYAWFAAYAINAVGVLLQVLALLILFTPFKNTFSQYKYRFSKASGFLMLLFCGVYLLRILAQALLIIPALAETAVLMRLFIIGFIHLNMLGLVSAFILCDYTSSFRSNSSRLEFKWPTILFIGGFILSELIIFVQGIFYALEWGRLTIFYAGLFFSSALLPISIFGYLLNFKRLRFSELIPNK